jgi:hypothetical protein
MSDRNYSEITSLSKSAFDELIRGFDVSSSTRSNEDDLARIEEFLELLPGTLDGKEFLVGNGFCPNGHQLTFFDHVYSSIKDGGHSKSFVVHVLLGNKLFVQEPKKMVCHICNERSEKPIDYRTTSYGCCLK